MIEGAVSRRSVPPVWPSPLRFLTTGRSLRIISVVGTLAIWEVVGRAAPLFTSYPSAIVTGFYQIAVPRNQLLPALETTLTGLVVGFAIAAVVGVAVGFAMGLSRLVEVVVDPYVSAIYSTPRIVLVPVLILWLGIGFEVRVAMAVLTAVFPIIINTYAGVKSVDQELLDTGRAFTASKWQSLRTIVAPACLPLIFTGLRIGISRALEGVIIAEMTAAVTGTGYLLLNYGRYFQTDKLMGPVVLIGFISIALARVVMLIGRTFTPWAPERRDQ